MNADVTETLINDSIGSQGAAATPLLAGYRKINRPNPEEALWLQTLFHRGSMWRWLARRATASAPRTRYETWTKYADRRTKEKQKCTLVFLTAYDCKGDHEWRSPVGPQRGGRRRTAAAIGLNPL